MPRLIVTTRGGEVREIDGEVGASVMEAIRGAGVDELIAMCGGHCSCATCHVLVDPAWLGALPPMTDDEEDLLDSAGGRAPTSRLSCQLLLAEPLDGLPLSIAPEE